MAARKVPCAFVLGRAVDQSSLAVGPPAQGSVSETKTGKRLLLRQEQAADWPHISPVPECRTPPAACVAHCSWRCSRLHAQGRAASSREAPV